jgi:hypothetical protein
MTGLGQSETPIVATAMEELACSKTGHQRRQLAQLLEPPCTDPYARWCGRGGVARLPPIPISGLRDLGNRSPEHLAAATALTEKIEQFMRESETVDIPDLRECEKAQLERLLASLRSASERLKDLLGGDDAPDGLVGRRPERITGGGVAGPRDIEVEDALYAVESGYAPTRG